MTNYTAKIDVLQQYCDRLQDIFATGQATEHTYRSALEKLIETLGDQDVRALNEPSRVQCGAPDFVVEQSDLPIGYIECKDINTDLDHVENDEQLVRYREGLPNLILTDYLEFRWYAEGALRLTARLARINGSGRIVIDQAGASQVAELFAEFFVADPPPIGRPRELAERMAAKARVLRDSIKLILAQEAYSSPLHDLLAGYREALITDLSPKKFADLQAQTATYGLFAARCRHTNTRPFTRKEAVFEETTPFLRDVFARIAGPSCDERIAWIIDDLARLLDQADMEAILSEFGRKTRWEDPVVHFYEDFLKAYDPHLRKIRGVYYTPEPVVSYIVQSVDYLLRDQFGLTDGLADTAMVTSEDGIPRPQVMILDPAAGTGTFLREVIATIRATIEEKGQGGAWPGYVQEHLLPRLFGFELLMAPYVICHLKLALEIGGSDDSFEMPEGERLRVFLTNTLEGMDEGHSEPLFASEIVREATSAYQVKREKPVMVVIGNPPYAGHSANKSPWISELIGTYKQGFPEANRPGQAKWLSDDYVKFIRFAQWRIERTGEGVIGFVTNHGYLNNRTFCGMRHSLMATFDEIYLLDLHGNSKKRERTPDGGKDENVFDIQQGVAIALFVKHKEGGDGPAKVFHADLWGEREAGPNGGKYGWLAANDVNTTEWTELTPKPPLYLFGPRGETLLEEYEAAWSIPEIFSLNGTPAPGVATQHDQFAISWTAEEAVAKVERLLATNSEDEARAQWRLCSQKQWQYDRAKRELADGSWREHIEPILYRPFDVRATVFDRNVAVHNRRERVMRHMLTGPNLGLCVGRAGQAIGSKTWEIAFVSRHPSDLNLFRRGGNCLFPLYLYRSQDFTYQPNLDQGFIEALSVATDLAFIPIGSGDCKTTFGPEDVFYYIYALLHSLQYRRRYADFLKSDFPRMPLTNDLGLFIELTNLGQRLVSLHFMEVEGNGAPNFPITGTNHVEKVYYTPCARDMPGRVWINSDQYFEGVASVTWDFSIGGYRPAEKWLTDRKGLFLSFDDISHYRRLSAALAETHQIMTCIDEAINAQGGWPLSQ
ncbi:MAG: N-6 DNA methylase [Gemmatimonadetes bacterium]|nr:N-6 DNA methylase [Gemmatimonadota bacterium]